ncbi:DUF2057 family protein [Vibrio sp. HN007]|uniref:YccT family protein n=1 Tax=Vibrio iocasae TaxID=3098914 RepID=UPI0035D3D8B1
MKSVFIATLGVLFSSSLFAAELIPGKNIRLLYLNETEVDSSTSPVALPDGFNQIVLRASATLGSGKERSVFDSAPFMMMFEATGKDVEIVAPKMYEYESAKRHFEGIPDMKLMSGGKEIPFTYEKVNKREGLLPYRDLDELVIEYNNQNNIYFGDEANIAGTATLAGSTAVASQKSQGNKTNVSSTLNINQLKAWYLKASKAERKEFKKWMIDQD